MLFFVILSINLYISITSKEQSQIAATKQIQEKYQVEENEIAQTYEEVANKTGKNITLLDIYPIGSIYMSTNGINPSSLFGGEWENYGQGRTLVGVGTSDKEFKENETGGESSHTLTIEEMPSHRHNYSISTYSTTTECSSNTNEAVVKGYKKFGTYTGEITNKTMSDIGGSQSHNNLQPYITCYMWRRIQ